LIKNSKKGLDSYQLSLVQKTQEIFYFSIMLEKAVVEIDERPTSNIEWKTNINFRHFKL